MPTVTNQQLIQSISYICNYKKYAETTALPHWVGIYPKMSSTSCDSNLGTCSDLLYWEDKTTLRWTQQDHTNWHSLQDVQDEMYPVI